MFPKISTEYIAQGLDPKTKHVMYQSAGPSEEKLLAWFKDHAIKGKFQGLECNIQKRYLINGRVFGARDLQKPIMWALIGVQFIFIIWKLAQ